MNTMVARLIGIGICLVQLFGSECCKVPSSCPLMCTSPERYCDPVIPGCRSCMDICATQYTDTRHECRDWCPQVFDEMYGHLPAENQSTTVSECYPQCTEINKFCDVVTHKCEPCFSICAQQFTDSHEQCKSMCPNLYNELYELASEKSVEYPVTTPKEKSPPNLASSQPSFEVDKIIHIVVGVGLAVGVGIFITSVVLKTYLKRKRLPVTNEYALIETSQ